MKIKACIVLDVPNGMNTQEAMDEIEATLQNAIENGDLTLLMDGGVPAEITDYSIVVEEVEE